VNNKPPDTLQLQSTLSNLKESYRERTAPQRDHNDKVHGRSNMKKTAEIKSGSLHSFKIAGATVIAKIRKLTSVPKFC
jgi:hypothetical protein